MLALIELGKQKKLWAVEVQYTAPGAQQERKIEIKRNLTAEELVKFREAIFRYGMQIPVKPQHWKIIVPMDILEVDIYQQDHYIPETYNNRYEEKEKPQE